MKSWSSWERGRHFFEVLNCNFFFSFKGFSLCLCHHLKYDENYHKWITVNESICLKRPWFVPYWPFFTLGSEVLIHYYSQSAIQLYTCVSFYLVLLRQSYTVLSCSFTSRMFWTLVPIAPPPNPEQECPFHSMNPLKLEAAPAPGTTMGQASLLPQ